MISEPMFLLIQMVAPKMMRPILAVEGTVVVEGSAGNC